VRAEEVSWNKYVREFAGVSCRLMHHSGKNLPSRKIMQLPFFYLHIKSASYTYIVDTREILEISQLRLTLMAAENNNKLPFQSRGLENVIGQLTFQEDRVMFVTVLTIFSFCLLIHRAYMKLLNTFCFFLSA